VVLVVLQSLHVPCSSFEAVVRLLTLVVLRECMSFIVSLAGVSYVCTSVSVLTSALLLRFLLLQPLLLPQQDLKGHMRAAGTVVHADVLREAGSRRSKGCGIVEYDSSE
jgi:RNA recognition motif. (a.k.a. RRM, RBD, or RNP domain)